MKIKGEEQRRTIHKRTESEREEQREGEMANLSALCC